MSARGFARDLAAPLRRLVRTLRIEWAFPAAGTPAGAADWNFASFDAWRAHLAQHADAWADQAAQQAAMRELVGARDGVCAACGRQVRFALRGDAAVPGNDLREGLACPACRLNARQRAALGLLTEGVANAASVYLTEQTSPAYVWTKQRFPAAVGSEFAIPAAKREALRHWLRAQGVDEPLREADVTALPFAAAQFDAIVSFDVLEHVPDYPAALREFARCLRPGGRLLVTVPFLEDSPATVVRARQRADGGIEHLLPEEIHGDPMAGGVLCWYHFGWDLLDTVRDAGFADAKWCRRWAPAQGLFGLWTLVATR